MKDTWCGYCEDGTCWMCQWNGAKVTKKTRKWHKHKKTFTKYNKVIGITFVLAYLIQVIFIDIFHFKAYIIVLMVAVTTHFVRYYFLFVKKKEVKRVNHVRPMS